MFAAIAALGPWSWIIAGLLLMGIELLAPGLFFIWLGLAALATGVAVGVLGLGWSVSAILFAGFATAGVFAGRALMARKGTEPVSATELNALSRNLIGKTVRLDQPIVNGQGRVRIDDTVWHASGDDAPAGAMVTILRLDNTALVVGRVDTEPS